MPRSVVLLSLLVAGLGTQQETRTSNQGFEQHSHHPRGGIDPRAPNWSLELAGSQSETGPTPERESSGGPVVCSQKGHPEMASRDSRNHGRRWQLLVGTV